MKQFILIMGCLLGLSAAMAQTEMPLSHSNSLGLPLVPQAPVHAAPKGVGTGTATAATVPARKGVVVVQSKPDPKASLSGPVSMASFYEPEGVIRVRVTTGTRYAAGDARKNALAAALLIQRDVAISCGKRCKALPAPAPVALENGEVQLDLLIQGLDRKISGQDMVQMVKGQPLAETTAQDTAAAVPAASLSVNKIVVSDPVAPTPSATPTATPTATPAAAAPSAPMAIPLGAAVVSATNRATRTSGTSSFSLTP